MSAKLMALGASPFGLHVPSGVPSFSALKSFVETNVSE
jgi:hypothetical protein